MSGERIERRLAAIVSADVVGYSRMMGADEDGTFARLNAFRAEFLHPKIAEYGGRVVKTMGDGTLIEFPSAVNAVQHAVDVQHQLAEKNAYLPEAERLDIRIGVNLGDVIVEGDDLFGDGVNVVARIESLAEPGQIWLSSSVYEQVRQKLAINFEDMGERSVKNIAEPVHVYRVAIDTTAVQTQGGLATEAMFRRPAVAVLPFTNMSGDPDQEYFADGLTEDIITALSLWRSFPVIARNSTFAYKGMSLDLRKVGQDLGAGYLVEGSVRKVGSRVRVSAQLINSETGHNVWAERYDRELEDIFELQDEITRAIASVVAPELEKAEAKISATKRTENMNAWDYLQLGRYAYYQIAEEALTTARDMFEHAAKLDPGFSQIWSALGHTYHRELHSGLSKNTEETKRRLMDMARRAVELDDANADAYWCLGMAYVYQGQVAEALQAHQRALSLNPSDPAVRAGLGATLIVAGRPQEAIQHLRTGLQLNPRFPRMHLFQAILARAFLDVGQHQEAADQAYQVLQQGRVYLDEDLVLMSALGHLNRTDEIQSFLIRHQEARGVRVSEIDFCIWWRLYQDPGPNEHLLEGLRKAGLPD